MITFRVGQVVADEANTMLTASAESGEAIAQAILDKQYGRSFVGLTFAEAEYLRDNLIGDADRVSQGRSQSAGIAFEKAGHRLGKQIESMVLARGQWYSKPDCPASPKPYVFNGEKRGHHSFRLISAKPSGHPGERLLTEQCKHCGGLIVDCPTISI